MTTQPIVPFTGDASVLATCIKQNLDRNGLLGPSVAYGFRVACCRPLTDSAEDRAHVFAALQSLKLVISRETSDAIVRAIA